MPPVRVGADVLMDAGVDVGGMGVGLVVVRGEGG